MPKLSKIVKCFLPLLSIFTVGSLSGCNIIFVADDSSEGSSQHSSLPPSSSSSIDDNIPQSWKDLFAFDNLTVQITSYVIGKNVTYYKFVDSIPYVCYQGEEEFHRFSDGVLEFDYSKNYNIFSYNEAKETYSCLNFKKYSDNDWLYDIEIFLSEGEIFKITEISHLNSVSLESVLLFYDRGVTSL